jgi:hypothetical protein
MYQVDENIVLLADEYIRYAIHKMGFNFDKGIEIGMEIDRLFDEEKPEKIEKLAKKINRNIYQVDKDIADISMKYLTVSLKNLGYEIDVIKEILVKVHEVFLCENENNVHHSLDQIEPEVDDNMLLRELIKGGIIKAHFRKKSLKNRQ